MYQTQKQLYEIKEYVPLQQIELPQVYNPFNDWVMEMYGGNISKSGKKGSKKSGLEQAVETAIAVPLIIVAGLSGSKKKKKGKK